MPIYAQIECCKALDVHSKHCGLLLCNDANDQLELYDKHVLLGYRSILTGGVDNVKVFMKVEWKQLKGPR